MLSLKVKPIKQEKLAVGCLSSNESWAKVLCIVFFLPQDRTHKFAPSQAVDYDASLLLSAFTLLPSMWAVYVSFTVLTLLHMLPPFLIFIFARQYLIKGTMAGAMAG